jgi:hypothetical protein
MTDLAVSKTGSWVHDELTVVRKSIRSSAPLSDPGGEWFYVDGFAGKGCRSSPRMRSPRRRHPSLAGSELDDGSGSVKRDALPVFNVREEER